MRVRPTLCIAESANSCTQPVSRVDTIVRSRVYTTTFAPNVNRRHTRGRRGKNVEGVSDLQHAYDEEREDAAMQRRKSRAAARRYREKTAVAHDKEFRMRGFRGNAGHKRPTDLVALAVSQPEQVDARPPPGAKERMRKQLESYARRERMGKTQHAEDCGKPTEIHGKAQAKAAKKLEAGIEALTARPAPVKVAPKAAFNVDPLVAKFRRDGRVPDKSLWPSIIAATQPADQKWHGRLVRLLLTLQGVEENPGPEIHIPSFRLGAVRGARVGYTIGLLVMAVVVGYLSFSFMITMDDRVHRTGPVLFTFRKVACLFFPAEMLHPNEPKTLVPVVYQKPWSVTDIVWKAVSRLFSPLLSVLKTKAFEWYQRTVGKLNVTHVLPSFRIPVRWPSWHSVVEPPLRAFEGARGIAARIRLPPAPVWARDLYAMLLRVIRMLLVMAGIEKNPGPEELCDHGCANAVHPASQRARILGACVKRKERSPIGPSPRHFLVVCKLCACQLYLAEQRGKDHLGRPMWFGFHPAVFEHYEGQYADLVREAEIREAVANLPFIEHSRSHHVSPAPSVRASADAHAIVHPHSPPPVQPPAPEQPPDSDDTSHHSEAPAVDPIPADALDGHEATHDDLREVFSSMGWFGFLQQWLSYFHPLYVYDHVIAYGGDRRIAPNRNVLELKRHLRVIQVQCGVPMLHFGVRTCIVATFMAWPTFVTIRNMIYFFRSSDYLSIVLLGILFVPLGLVALFFSLSNTPQELWYVPHIVSSVLMEYNRGTNPTALRASIRQKMCRLASLPIIDAHYVKLLSGTELIIESAAIRQDFYMMGGRLLGAP